MVFDSGVQGGLNLFWCLEGFLEGCSFFFNVNFVLFLLGLALGFCGFGDFQVLVAPYFGGWVCSCQEGG